MERIAVIMLNKQINSDVSTTQPDECRTKLQEEIWFPDDSRHLTALITELARRLETEWNDRGFEHGDLRIRTVLEEAILNAWVHGNKRDKEKTIAVRWRFNHDFYLEVKDEGNGFDINNIPDPTTYENITKPCGRGVFIMKHFSDNVMWNNETRTLTIRLSKHFNPLA